MERESSVHPQQRESPALLGHRVDGAAGSEI